MLSIALIINAQAVSNTLRTQHLHLPTGFGNMGTLPLKNQRFENKSQRSQRDISVKPCSSTARFHENVLDIS